MAQARRVRVKIEIKHNACAAIEVPNPPMGTKLVPCPTTSIEVRGFNDTLLIEAYRSCRKAEVNGREVPREEFDRLEEFINELIAENRVVSDSYRTFSPCPTIAYYEVLVEPGYYNRLRRLARRFR